MWKIVIADDEPKIRQGLRELVESFSLSLRVCGEAKNGLEALKLIEREQPDIALVDICMPKLNGLQLLERIRDTHTGCRTIIVSGYNEFTYAKEALTLGVRSYILKPIEEEELYEAICSLTEELSRERSKQRFIDLANYQLEQHREYLQGVFFNDWIEGKLSSGERQDQKELLSVHIGEEAALILVSTQNNRNLSLRMGDGRISDDVYQFALKNILRELLGKCEPVYLFMDRYQNVAGIFHCPKQEESSIKRYVEESLEQTLGGTCTVVTGTCEEAHFPEAYGEALREVQKALECRPVVTEAKKYLYEHFREPDMELNLVARSIGISPAYLSRLMKQELGMSFKDFLTSLRINEAIVLMRSTGCSINEIADMVGYKSQHYFSTVFKNSMGISPSEHRKNIG
ncbi:MAG: response regulator [Lachnospiraceae bacterium]|nr:response regulator [Lachnospiraceae bacterium]